MFRIAIIQLDIAWEDIPNNLAHAGDLVSASQIQPGDWIVLPEMFPTGFSMNAQGVATRSGGIVTDWMSRIACRHKVHVLGSFAEEHSGGYSNTAMLIAPDGSTIGSYRKIHLFRREGCHYCPGDQLFIFSCGPLVATVFICYDLRFPEVFRAAASKGVELFFVLANWPDIRQSHWEILLKARALENQAYVCACNRTGTDPSTSYVGGSCLILPDGNVSHALREKEDVAIWSLDAGVPSAVRKAFPCLPDRRIGLYERLAEEGRLAPATPPRDT